MKDKLLDLYKNNLNEFVEFVSEFYGVERLNKIYAPYKYDMAEEINVDEDLIFQINDNVYSVETIIEDINETYLRLQLMKDYGLI